jgi:predicted DNA-binding transcriptional regulator YafY
MQTLPGTTHEEEVKRTARILEIVRIIATAPRRYGRKALADRFEISERMITKDLSIIRNGLKLEILSSPDGYYFEKTPSLPSLQYSFSEALALLTAVQSAQQMGSASPDLSAAVARLEALFPEDFGPLLRQCKRSPIVTAHRQRRQQMLALLNRALLSQHKVQMVYETASRGGDITQRIVRPYAVIPYVRSWQLVAYCEMRQTVRMFKLDRIQHAIIQEDRYEIPDSFDIDDYMGNTWGLLRGNSQETEDIELCFDNETGRWVAEEEWHPTQQVEHLDNGCVLFRVRIVITSEFVKWVLRYGSQVQVKQPTHLRHTIHDEHTRAANLNN